MADKRKFWPVRGTEEQVLAQPPWDGKIYFTTDTDKIYLDIQGSKHLMGGGSSGIIYTNGSEQEIKKLVQDDDDYTYSMAFSALENPSVLPKQDDLILNADGRFFRVTSIGTEDSLIYVTLLAVSGTGGGGGGGGSGTQDLTLTIDSSTLRQYQVLVYGKSHNVAVTATSETDPFVTLSFVFTKADGSPIDQFSRVATSGEPYLLDLSFLPIDDGIKMVVTADAENTTMTRKPERSVSGIKVVTMGIEKTVESAYIPIVKANDPSGRLSLSYTPIGDPSISLLLHTYVDGLEITTPQEIPADNYGKPTNVLIEKQSHGVHNITLNVSTVLNQEEVFGNPIQYQGAWASEDDLSPIIWIGKNDSTIINYENSYIYFMVYDPIAFSNDEAANIYLYKNNVEVSQINAKYSDDDWIVWDISNTYSVGDNTFSIGCRTSKVDIPIFVTEEGARPLGLVEPDYLIMNVTTAGRSSAEIKSQRNVLVSSAHPEGSTITLNNFNWQNNGWKNSEGVDSDGVDSGSYLSIANGASVTMALSSALDLNRNKDYTIELRFRVRNVQQYSTLIRTIPKYFYMVPDAEAEGGWRPTYTITINSDEDEVATGPSLYEYEIIEQGYKIGVDKYGNLLMDEANTVKREDTSTGVAVRWLNDAGYGFAVGTQEAYFKTPSGIANVRYSEDKIINLSMVVSKQDSICYLYLNGILSGTIGMPTGTGSAFSIGSAFEFNSEYCDFDLYRFRIYELGLTMPNVIHNYLSDMHSIVLFDQNQIAEKLDPTSLSYNLLVEYNNNHPGEQSMPYAVWQITGGSDELLPWKKGNKRSATVDFVNPVLDEALENGLDEWTYYTHSPSFHAEGVNIDVQGTSSQKYPRRNYKTKFKDAGETWVYTKGSLAGLPLTEEYEVLDKDGVAHTLVPKFHMDTASIGVNKFTWKIDYMESSESYNTGFANLMGNLKHPLYTKHPLDDLNQGLNTSELRTTVYGFPVLTFHKYANGKYEYIGKYNLNLDKGANEAYGFELKKPQPFVNQRTKKVLNPETNSYEDKVYQPTIKEIAECWEMKDNQGNWCSFKYPSAAERTTGFRTYQKNSQKLEILNHYEYRYSFYADELDEAYDYNSFTDTNTQVEYSNVNQINDYLYEKHYNLERLFIWLDSTNPDTATNTPLESSVEWITSYNCTGEGESSSPVYIYTTAQEDFNEETTYYIKNGDEYEEVQLDPEVGYEENVVYYVKIINYYNTTFTKDSANYRLEKFRNEFNKHLDKEYCLTYFVLTELLLCYDSRGKNLMLASFGPISRDPITNEPGEYIWYPIFYDIDTQLGLNNSGAYLWDYDADVTKDNLFSTPTSVLWNNLYTVFYDEIVQKYRVLRGVEKSTSVNEHINGSLSLENIVGAYEYNAGVFNSYAMQGVRPIVAVGLDEYYKYLAPALTATDFNQGKYYAGYYDTTGAHKYQATPTYAYACQGDKKLTTELLIRNRLNYIDSWWLGGDYQSNVVVNQIFVRANANMSTTSDTYLDSNLLDELPAKASPNHSLAPYSLDGTIHNINDYFDGRPGAKIKPFLHQYVSYFHDSQPSEPIKYDGSAGQEDGIWTNVDPSKLSAYRKEPDYSQQIHYFPGGDYISSLGDISLMYPNALQIFHGQRLLDLKIGSDIPGYKNPLLTSSSDWELSEMPLLKSANFSKLSAFNKELNLRASEKLQEFRALGSTIERVNFASGAPLDTVHLPATMTTISLIQNKNLNKILTSPPVIVEPIDPEDPNSLYEFKDKETYKGLYIEGVTDFDPVLNSGKGHSLANLEIQGGGLGYHSYTILKNLYDLKYGASTKQNLSVGLTEVEWTPYVQIEYGTPYQQGITYYILNDHNMFDLYTSTDSATWNTETLNGKIFIYNENYNKTTGAEEKTITDLSLLNNFIELYNNAKDSGATQSQFNNLSGGVTVPAITGNLYVSNTSDFESMIKEEDLTDKYKKYFPNLEITAKFIRAANLTKYVRSYESGKIETITIERGGNVPKLPSGNAPSQTYYDFIGWTLEDPNTTANPTIALVYNPNATLPEERYTTTEAWDALAFDNNTSVITLYAYLVLHEYVTTFYDVDGTTVLKRTYQTVNNKVVDPLIIPSIDNQFTLDLEMTYKFKGWSRTPLALGTTAQTILAIKNGTVKLSDITVSQDLNFYACYTLEDVHAEATRKDYFTFTPLSGGYTDISYSNISARADSAYDKFEGVEINIKNGVELRGKITLPSHDENGNPVISIGDSFCPHTKTEPITWSGARYITHIFIEKPCELRLINANAFAVGENAFRTFPSNLVYVEFPEGLRVIYMGAFRNVNHLDISLINFPSTLLSISQQAFSRAFDSTTSTSLFKFPSSLAYIGQSSFTNIASQIGILAFGEKDKGSRLESIMGVINLMSPLPDSLGTYAVFGGTLRPSTFEFWAVTSTQLNNIKALIKDSSASTTTDINILAYFYDVTNKNVLQADDYQG